MPIASDARHVPVEIAGFVSHKQGRAIRVGKTQGRSAFLKFPWVVSDGK